MRLLHTGRLSREWDIAREWATWLAEGKSPEVLAIPQMTWNGGEEPYLQSTFEYRRLVAGSGQYAQHSTFAFGSLSFIAGMSIMTRMQNARNRREAKLDTKPSWRDRCISNTVVTNQRVLCQVRGRNWLSFYHGAVLEFLPNPKRYYVRTNFNEAEPMQLGGPAAPTLAVLMAWLLRGRDWTQEPAISALLNDRPVPEVEVPTGDDAVRLDAQGHGRLVGGEPVDPLHAPSTRAIDPGGSGRSGGSGDERRGPHIPGQR